MCGPGAGQGTVTRHCSGSWEICKYDPSGEHWTESEFYEVTVTAACHQCAISVPYRQGSGHSKVWKLETGAVQ